MTEIKDVYVCPNCRVSLGYVGSHGKATYIGCDSCKKRFKITGLKILCGGCDSIIAKPATHKLCPVCSKPLANPKTINSINQTKEVSRAK